MGTQKPWALLRDRLLPPPSPPSRAQSHPTPARESTRRSPTTGARVHRRAPPSVTDSCCPAPRRRKYLKIYHQRGLTEKAESVIILPCQPQPNKLPSPQSPQEKRRCKLQLSQPLALSLECHAARHVLKLALNECDSAYRMLLRMRNSSILSFNNSKRITLRSVPWRLCSKGRPNMEDTIIQWAAAAGMILAGIVAELLIGDYSGDL